MTRPPPRRCARAGCRAWAMRGQPWCRAHRTDHADDRDDHQPGDPATFTATSTSVSEDERRARMRAFARRVREENGPLLDGMLQRAIDALGSQTSLAGEIGALRLVLQRVMTVDALDGDLDQLAVTVTRIVDGIVRARRMQHALSGDHADELANAFTKILSDLGLGDEP